MLLPIKIGTNRVTFKANGKREFVTREKSFPLTCALQLITSTPQ